MRLVHLSDLHFPPGRDAAAEDALHRLVAAERPRLVVVTGDLTHDGSAGSHAEAARFLHGLGRPLLVVPGDHDVRVWPPAEVRRPFASYDHHWKRNPIHRSSELIAAGLSSVLLAGRVGYLSRLQLATAGTTLRRAAPGGLRVVAFHHSPLEAPLRSGRRALRARKGALRELAAAGADLVLAGHIHQATVAGRAELEIDATCEPPMTIAVAPAFGRPRPHRRFEVRGLNIVDVEERSLAVRTLVWAPPEWQLAVERQFPRRHDRKEHSTGFRSLRPRSSSTPTSDRREG